MALGGLLNDYGIFPFSKFGYLHMITKNIEIPSALNDTHILKWKYLQRKLITKCKITKNKQMKKKKKDNGSGVILLHLYEKYSHFSLSLSLHIYSCKQ